MGAQSEANDRGTAWAEQWGSKLEKQETIRWLTDMGPMPPQCMLHALIAAAMPFRLARAGMGRQGHLSAELRHAALDHGGDTPV